MCTGGVMRTLKLGGSVRTTLRLLGIGLVCVLVFGWNHAPAAAAGDTWYVTSASDSASDGDLATRSGSLRFVLAHATGGDFVSFARFDSAADKIFINSTLTVPDGVAVGRTRDAGCGSFKTPLTNLEADAAISPVVSLGSGATFRNIDIGGGGVSLKITGANAVVCGVGLGIEYDRDGLLIMTLPPSHSALVVDAPAASVYSSYFNGAIIVSTRGSDSRLGDTVAGSGEGNLGGCGNAGRCPITVLADATGAAQRVTLRDPFPRALVGLVGNGVAGGDDLPTHANNWAQTPTILTAQSYDGFATVQVAGMANPFSVVDIFFDDQLTLARQAPVTAAASGVFTFTGALPPRPVQVFAASTLKDPAHLTRVGSSSQLSGAVAVSAVQHAGPQLSALGSLTDLSGLASGPAHPGDVLRFSAVMINVGPVAITHINSTAMNASPGLSVRPGSGAIQGQGSGFSASDAGFTGGSLAPGQSATYTLDFVITATAPPGQAVISLEVGADEVISIPVVGRMQITANNHNRIMLPLVLR